MGSFDPADTNATINSNSFLAQSHARFMESDGQISQGAVYEPPPQPPYAPAPYLNEVKEGSPAKMEILDSRSQRIVSAAYVGSVSTVHESQTENKTGRIHSLTCRMPTRRPSRLSYQEVDDDAESCGTLVLFWRKGMWEDKTWDKTSLPESHWVRYTIM